MTVTVNTVYDLLHGTLAAGCERADCQGSDGAVWPAWIRSDHGGGDRRASRGHRANLLPPLRPQGRGAFRRLARAAGPDGWRGDEGPGFGPADRCGGRGSPGLGCRPQRSRILAAAPGPPRPKRGGGGGGGGGKGGPPHRGPGG